MTDEALVIPEDCLAIFVDDNGHEAFAPTHDVYGLGGCAAMARDLELLIRAPWRQIRKDITGSPETPLHAAEFPKLVEGPLRSRHMQAVATFFQRPFFRFATMITRKTVLAPELGGTVRTVSKVLQQRIGEVVALSPAKSVALIFESSQRTDRLVEREFQGFTIAEGDTVIPVECFFMRKAYGDPALEVADFVINTAGYRVKKHLANREITPDRSFESVFDVHPNLGRFTEVTVVEPTNAPSA